MWRSRLFWKLFASYTALNLVATITFFVIVSRWQSQQVLNQTRLRLQDSAALIRTGIGTQLAEGTDTSLQVKVRRLSRQIATRVTIIDMQGNVLAESTCETPAQVSLMENHKDRLELVRAASSGYGTSQRMSPTLQQPMLYVALRAGTAGRPTCLVRTAVALDTVAAHVADARKLVWPFPLVVSAAVALLTYFLAARVVQPVRTLTTAAESIAAGELTQRVFLEHRDELGGLARSFNRMTAQLEVREAELLESRGRLMTVLEGMVEGVIALDDRERVVLANSAAGRLLNFRPVEAEGRPLLEVVRSRPVNEAIAAATAGASQEVEFDSGDDEVRMIGIHGTVLSSGPSTRCILVLHDVTDLRRLESLRQEFVANVSHELKTPLSSIRAYAETLLSGAIHDEHNNRRFVEQIDEQSERLHDLILDLLSIARIESGQQVFDIDSVALPDVARACVRVHSRAAEMKSIQLALDLQQPEIVVQADAEGIRQILSNLVDNAIKYTPVGGVVTLTCRQTADEALVIVRDSGPGIPADSLPRVFERFFRVDKARSREVGGTGLGLSIVKHLAQSFGGRVDVKSQLGDGTEFTVGLPLV